MLIPHTSPLMRSENPLFSRVFTLFLLAFTPSTWYNKYGLKFIKYVDVKSLCCMCSRTSAKAFFCPLPSFVFPLASSLSSDYRPDTQRQNRHDCCRPAHNERAPLHSDFHVATSYIATAAARFFAGTYPAAASASVFFLCAISFSSASVKSSSGFSSRFPLMKRTPIARTVQPSFWFFAIVASSFDAPARGGCLLCCCCRLLCSLQSLSICQR